MEPPRLSCCGALGMLYSHDIAAQMSCKVCKVCGRIPISPELEEAKPLRASCSLTMPTNLAGRYRCWL